MNLNYSARFFTSEIQSESTAHSYQAPLLPDALFLSLAILRQIVHSFHTYNVRLVADELRICRI